jgi:uncharacterized protein (DUF1684 family)
MLLLRLALVVLVMGAPPGLADEQSYRSAVLAFRAKVDRHFRDPHLSPLTQLDQQNYVGLNYFEIHPKMDLKGGFVQASDDSIFAMPTYNNETLPFAHYGTVTASYEGREIQLKVFRRKVGERLSRTVLIPFRDVTNGQETYAGGRYIELDLPFEEPLRLDFNKATNPWCAYNSKYACPIPPAENHLDFPVRAGEKRFK